MSLTISQFKKYIKNTPQIDYRGSTCKKYGVTHESAPMAICKAALKALEGK